jgi:NADH-quinone oxidoreductase subunit A
MQQSLFFCLFLFLITMVLLSFILYTLSLFLFSISVEDELQIERLYAYECGYNSFSDARDTFDVKFYLVAVLFLIFDLEIALFFPMSICLESLNAVSCSIIFFFIFVLVIGFIYEWKKGGLDW